MILFICRLVCLKHCTILKQLKLNYANKIYTRVIIYYEPSGSSKCFSYYNKVKKSAHYRINDLRWINVLRQTNKHMDRQTDGWMDRQYPSNSMDPHPSTWMPRKNRSKRNIKQPIKKQIWFTMQIRSFLKYFILHCSF